MARDKQFFWTCNAPALSSTFLGWHGPESSYLFPLAGKGDHLNLYNSFKVQWGELPNYVFPRKQRSGPMQLNYMKWNGFAIHLVLLHGWSGAPDPKTTSSLITQEYRRKSPPCKIRASSTRHFNAKSDQSSNN